MGAGAGLVSVALAWDANKPDTARRALGMEARSVGEALASCEQPAGELLRECQGQQDLALATSCAFKLARRMEGDGCHFVHPLCDDATVRDAIGAGVTALAVWRAGKDNWPCGGQADAVWRQNGGRAKQQLAAVRVAWQGVVTSISADVWRHAVSLSSVSSDWLESLVMPGDATAEEAAEHIPASRSALLDGLIKALKAKGGRGQRQSAVDKIGRALALLMAGESVNTAAEQAGFRRSPGRGARGGGAAAGDRFRHALRRVGICVPRRQRAVASV